MLDEHLKYPNALPKGYTLERYRIVQTLAEDNVSLTYLASTPQQVMVVIVEYLPKHLALRDKANHHVQLKGPNCKYDYEWGLSQYHQEISGLIDSKHANEHINVNTILASLKANNTLYKVSEYIHGIPLKTYAQNKILSESQLITLFEPLLAGLHAIHQAGYLHGDITPYTLVIENETEKPLITQLGTTKYLFAGQKNSPPLSLTHYAAYEQHHDIEKQGIWTDIYAMGAVLYELTTDIAPVASLVRLNTALQPPPSNDPIVAAQFLAKEHYSEPFLAAIDHAIKLAITERPHSILTWKEELGIIPDTVFDDSDDSPIIANQQQSEVETASALPIKKELSITGLANTDQQNQQESDKHPSHMDFAALNKPLSISEKLANNRKRYITIILLISLITIIVGGAFYYIQQVNEADDKPKHERLTTLSSQSNNMEQGGKTHTLNNVKLNLKAYLPLPSNAPYHHALQHRLV